MTDSSRARTSLWARSNDLQSRDLPSRLSRFVRAKLRRWSDAGALVADDPRVLKAWRKGWDADHFVKLHRWAQEGFRPKVVYDIGAHEGLWSAMCQEVLAPERCFLFEPQPEFQKKAESKRPQSGAMWEVLPFALGDKEEIETMHITQNAAASSLLTPIATGEGSISETRAVAQHKVQVLPLDSLVNNRKLPTPNLVKIDVQGFEGKVLAGGRATLSEAERLVVEVSLQPLYAGQSLMPDVLQTLVGLGFELEDIHETFRQWPGRLWQVDLWMKRRS